MNVLAVGCHPDDVEIACAGTLAKCVKRGDKVVVAHLCNGSLGHVVIPPHELIPMRANEAKEAGKLAGIEVIEARINYLAYAPEIAAVMLRRQQADAIISAREKIVEGAVSMVKMAIDQLADKDVVELDEERKAAMVSNLLVVLCSDESAQPVVNAGTLHH